MILVSFCRPLNSFVNQPLRGLIFQKNGKRSPSGIRLLDSTLSTKIPLSTFVFLKFYQNH